MNNKVKVGDFFCLERSGFSGNHSHFFQVIGLKGTKQVVIKEVNKKEVDYGLVKPIKDDFLSDSRYVKDNIGDSKIVRIRDEERNYEDSPIYITFSKYYSRSGYDYNDVFIHSIYDEAYLWKGKAKKDLLEYLD